MSGAGKVIFALFVVAVLVFVPVATAYGSAFALYSGPTAPVGIAVSRVGTVYWANYDTGQLLAMPSGASSPTVLLSGLTHPSGVAISSGNIYFSEATDSFSDVKEIVNNAVVTLFSVPTSVPFISVDKKGNVYFEAGRGCNGAGYANSIKEWVRATGRIKTILTGVGTNPTFGQVYVSGHALYFSTCSGDLERLSPIHGGTPQVLLTGLGSGPTVSPNGITVDSKGNVFYTNYWVGVGELPAGSTSPVTLSTAGGTHYCVALDKNGNVYYTDNMGGTIWEIPRA